MKKILFILLSLFWAVYVQAASLSVDIHTPNLSKPYQFAKVYFLPDWNDKDFAFADQDEMPCTEVCPQKTDYDCKYGTESYVNGCGLTCSRCLECYGCEARGYTLSECPVNGICLNDCCNKLYKLESCKSGYVKEGNSCRAENCTENASLCDSTTEKCVNGKCVEKDCTEYPGKCGSNQTCVDGECIAKDCNNTPSLCTATEKCQLQNGVYKCVCSPTCTNETNCPNGYDTPVANGCGSTCSVCRTTPAEAIIFTFSPDTDNVTLTIPAREYSGISKDYSVDWGDGTQTTNVTGARPTHTYAKAGNYDVTITGILGSMSSFPSNIIQYITQVKQLNLSSLKELYETFRFCKNLSGTIPELPPNLENARYVFDSPKLTGSLPSLPTSLKRQYGMFAGCSGLTGNIPPLPAGLQEYGTYMFQNCKGLTGPIPNIPDSLWDTTSMFDGCSGLSGNIPQLPSGLSHANGMFYGCSGLTGNIPQLPSGLTKAYHMFNGCSGLTGNIPELPRGLIYGGHMFNNCSELTGNIPELPSSLTDAMSMFSHCSKLTGSIPELPAALKDGSYMFSYCSRLTGNIPELPSGLTEALYMFSNCEGLTGNIPKLPNSLIWGHHMFLYCSNLTGVTPINGLYPYQYLSNTVYYQDMVYGTSDAVRSKFPQSWGGTLPD